MEKLTLKNLLTILKYLIIYYLSSKMICFAIPKMLFMQFRIPNYTTYITLAEMTKYQHMWSFFGRSYNYNLFIGITEFLIGALILFPRTRLIALLISLGVCANILILNFEFEILFATSHIIVDFAITIILLTSYRKSLYEFFIKLGGRLDGLNMSPKNKVAKFFPYVFLLSLSISYFIFSFYIKTTYIGDENIIGAYEIKTIEIDDSTFKPQKGNLGTEPMLFIEHNNQFVLSIEDTTYTGAYMIENQEINIGLERATKFGMKTLKGIVEIGKISGEIEEGHLMKVIFKRIEGSKNYLNDLYR